MSQAPPSPTAAPAPPLAGLQPGRRLLQALGALLALGLGGVLSPVVLPLWWGLLALLAAALLVEGLWLARRPTPKISRTCALVWPVGRWQTVRLRLDNPTDAAVVGAAFDHTPGDIETLGLPQDLRVPRRGWAALEYRARAQERGPRRLGPLSLRLVGPLGLWERQVVAPCFEQIKVYPDFREVGSLALLARDDRLGLLGVHTQRRRGSGTEFYQLREHQRGDSPRLIDWKASARRAQLIAKEHRDEQDQQLILLLDCGHRMRTRDGLLSHFDRALNAAILLAYVALRQGDSVGLLATGGQDRWIAPKKGAAALGALLRGVYDLHSTASPPDLLQATRRLLTLQRRRALVVVLTNLRAEDEGELLLALRLLRQRHLVLVASLREPVLRELAEVPVERLIDAQRVAAVAMMSQERRRALERARKSGAVLVDEEPERLPASLINRYLDVKRAQRL
ncbi:DUF58 domain-containing protein [Myxococcota bacterium]|nr:DUF58 domain-containing protein [Myxococcota bacterium]